MLTLAPTSTGVMPTTLRCAPENFWSTANSCASFWEGASNADIRWSRRACISKREKSNVKSRWPEASKAGTSARLNVAGPRIARRGKQWHDPSEGTGEATGKRQQKHLPRRHNQKQITTKYTKKSNTCNHRGHRGTQRKFGNQEQYLNRSRFFGCTSG